MRGPRGLLLVLADPPATLEEEFNDWYDTEHLPERAAIEGFETARRYVACGGDGPRYAAIYDLAGLDVLEGGAYRAVSGENFSPWTRRVVASSRPQRMTARKIDPAGGVTGPCARLLLVRASGVDPTVADDLAAGLAASFAGSPAHIASRVFAGDEPAPDFVLGLSEFAGDRVPPLAVGAFGRVRAHLSLVATYRPLAA